jgi:hypothetical protein
MTEKMNTQQRRRSRVSPIVVALCTLLMGSAEGFVPSGNPMPYKAFVTTPTPAKVLDVPARKTNTELNMFMGSDGGILGIGTPELVSASCILQLKQAICLQALTIHISYVSRIFFVPIILVHNFVGGLFCIGSLRFVQGDEGNWKVCTKSEDFF